MTSPLAHHQLVVLPTVSSTQDVAGKLLVEDASAGGVLAYDQLRGRGRFQREWLSQPGSSLTVSLLFRAFPDHPQPHLFGMACAIAVASAFHVRVSWPNDLVYQSKKLGGILTELMRDEQGRLVPVVGIGINLTQITFPEDIAERATSLRLVHGDAFSPEEALELILLRLKNLPDPESWGSLAEAWSIFDDTRGKRYRLPTGDEAIAIGIGTDGELLCSLHGESISVLAADAIFGDQGETDK